MTLHPAAHTRSRLPHWRTQHIKIHLLHPPSPTAKTADALREFNAPTKHTKGPHMQQPHIHNDQRFLGAGKSGYTIPERPLFPPPHLPFVPRPNEQAGLSLTIPLSSRIEESLPSLSSMNGHQPITSKSTPRDTHARRANCQKTGDLETQNQKGLSGRSWLHLAIVSLSCLALPANLTERLPCPAQESRNKVVGGLLPLPQRSRVTGLGLSALPPDR